MEVVYEVSSWYRRIVNKCVKVIKGRVSVGFGDSVFWGVDRGVGAGVGSSDGIKFDINNGYS